MVMVLVLVLVVVVLLLLLLLLVVVDLVRCSQGPRICLFGKYWVEKNCFGTHSIFPWRKRQKKSRRTSRGQPSSLGCAGTCTNPLVEMCHNCICKMLAVTLVVMMALMLTLATESAMVLAVTLVVMMALMLTLELRL